MRSVAVYCGSSPGHNPVYREAATELGALLAKHQMQLVYGGGRVGLMGTIADSVLASGGWVLGVITEALLAAEVGHTDLTELEVVPTMHERKARMAERADGFVAMPGGFGTFEELFEVATWTQLGIHTKPVVLLNVDGFWDPLLQQIKRAGTEGFMKEIHTELVQVATTPAEALDLLQTPIAGFTPKWVQPKSD